MQLEVEIALNFLLSFLYNKLPRRRVNQFGEELEKAIKVKFQNHWYVEQPSKGSAYRCLKTASPIDPILEWACLEAGIQLTDIKDNLPDELSIWIDPGEVSYRLSERSPIKIIYSIRNQVCHSQQAPNSLSDPIQYANKTQVLFDQADKKQHLINISAFPDNYKYNNNTILRQHQQQDFIPDLTKIKRNQQSPLSHNLLIEANQQQLIQQHDYMSSYAGLADGTGSMVAQPQAKDYHHQQQTLSGTDQYQDGLFMNTDCDKQFRGPSSVLSSSSWSSGSSSASSGTASSSSSGVQIKPIVNGAVPKFDICLNQNHNSRLATGSSLGSSRITANESLAYSPGTSQQRSANHIPVMSNFIFDKYCLESQSQPSAPVLQQQNNIKFPTTINDYSLLSSNANQNTNINLHGHSPSRSVIAQSVDGHGNMVAMGQQQSRIISRNSSCSSSNSMASTSSGSVGSTSLRPVAQSGYLLCGSNNQPGTSSTADQSLTSTNKVQPLVFTAAMFAQTKFGSTKLKNQANIHGHHPVNGSSQSSISNSNHQHLNQFKSSASNQQNSMLPLTQSLGCTPPSFISPSSSLKWTNQQQQNQMHSQQQSSNHHHNLNQFIHQNNIKYNHASAINLHYQQRQRTFSSCGNSSSSARITSPNLQIEACHVLRNNSNNDEIVDKNDNLEGHDISSINQLQQPTTNEINDNIQHNSDLIVNPSFRGTLDGSINNHQQNQNKKFSTTVVTNSSSHHYSSSNTVNDPGLIGLVGEFCDEAEKKTPRDNGNSGVKEETLRQLEEIFHLNDSDCGQSLRTGSVDRLREENGIDLTCHNDNLIEPNQNPVHCRANSNNECDSNQQQTQQTTICDLVDITTSEHEASRGSLEYEFQPSKACPSSKSNDIQEVSARDFVLKPSLTENSNKMPTDLLVNEDDESNLSVLFSNEPSSLTKSLWIGTLMDGVERNSSDHQEYKKDDEDGLSAMMIRLMLQTTDNKTSSSETPPMNEGTNNENDLLKELVPSNSIIPIMTNQGGLNKNIEISKQLNLDHEEINSKNNDSGSNTLEKTQCYNKDASLFNNRSSGTTIDYSVEVIDERHSSTNAELNERLAGKYLLSLGDVDSPQDKIKNSPMIDIDGHVLTLTLEAGKSDTRGVQSIDLMCSRINETSNNMTSKQQTNSEDESLMNGHSQNQLISTSNNNTATVSVNGSVTSANYGSSTNQQCKQQTQQQTHQLLLAN